jgi:signal peptidase I
MEARLSFRTGPLRWWRLWSVAVRNGKGAGPALPRPPRRLRGRDLVEALLAAVGVALLLKLFVVEFCRVPSASMMPTLLPGDYVVVSRVAYAVGLPARVPLTSVWLPVELRWWYRLPRRWDIVVLDFPGEAGQLHPPVPEYYIKRVVGLPGDTLRFAGDTLFINRVAYWLPGLQEKPRRSIVPYRGMELQISPQTLSEWLPVLLRDGAQVELRQGDVFINGQRQQRYVFRQNYLFVMGDNYRNSWDSRHWGLVPQSAIIGKAVLLYYSRDTNGHVRWNRIGRLLH